MKLIEIDDTNIQELQIYQTLRDNQFKATCFVADSPKVVNLLLENDIKVRSVLATQEYYDEFSELLQEKQISNMYLATKELMQDIVGHKLHHNCMMHGTRPEPNELSELGDNILMLDNITSAENIGSIARSMAGLGVNSYLIPKHSPHPYGRRSVRVSMGYMSHLQYHIYDEITATIGNLKQLGYKIYAAEITADSTPLSQVKVSKKWVLLMGHEGQGISNEILKLCDEVVSIEMQEDVKSFNVGVAASLIMYQFKNGYNSK